MAQHQHGPINFWQSQQRIAHQLALFELCRPRVRPRSLARRFLDLRLLLVGFAQKFSPPLQPPDLVVTKIQRDTPKKCGKFARRLISLSFFKQPQERVLLQVFAAMRIAEHAGTQTPDRLFPTLHQARKLRMVVVPFYTAHRFLISSRAQQRKCRKNRALHARSSGLTFHK